jgi:ankyrin repeat protein
VDSLTPDDKEIWRAIRKELEDIGITIAAFDANKDFIFSWFTNAVESGAFNEEEPPNPPESTCSSGTHSPVLSSSSFNVDELDTPDVSGGISPLHPAENQHKDIEPAASKQTAAASDSTRHISRIAILIATLSRPNRRFSAAVRAGDPLEVKRILKDPASRHALNDHTLYSELGNALRLEYRSLIRPMIDARAPVNPINAKAGHNESSPLMIAVKNGDQSIVRYLLKNGADVNYNIKAGHVKLSPLMIAVKSGDQSIVRYLLENGADVNHNADTWVYNSNALQCAMQTKSESMVSLLLAYRADVNAQRATEDGCVAIHQALKIGCMPIVGLLLDHGANIEAYCSSHGTPIVIAINTGNVQALRYLVGKGADVNRMTWTMDTMSQFTLYPLEKATHKGSLEMVRILVEYDAVDGLKLAYEHARDTRDLLNRIGIMRLLDQQISRLQNDRTTPAGTDRSVGHALSLKCRGSIDRQLINLISM